MQQVAVGAVQFDGVQAQRPAAQRAEQLKTRHAFKAELDAEARRFMFPQNERLKQ